MGDNSARIAKISKQLDYSIESTSERLSLLYQLLMEYDENIKEWFPNEFFSEYFTRYYNPNIKQSQWQSYKLPVCYNLSYMAGYVLFNKEEGDIGVIREKTQKYRDTKHVSLEQTMEEQGEEAVRPKTSNYVQQKPTITEKDREEIPELESYREYIKAVEQEMEVTENEREKYRLKRILKEVRQDQMAVKLMKKEPITFTRLKPTKQKINFDEDTGYELDNGSYHQISHNEISFKEESHISNLLKLYSPLRQHTEEDPQSDMKYILDVLDDLIEGASLNEHFRYILIRRIDGVTYESIAFELHKEMGLKLSPAYISSIFLNRIPKLICDYYMDDYEEWYYTFKEKGDYKRCTQCGRNFLRSPKYFRRDKKSADGLSTICKEDRRKTDAERDRKRRGA